MRSFPSLFLVFWLAACTSIKLSPEELYALQPGVKTDGLSYHWQAHEQSYYGGGSYSMLPDGSVYKDGREKIGRNVTLWQQISQLVVSQQPRKQAQLENPYNPNGYLSLASMAAQESALEANDCMSHWTEIRMRVRVGDKRAYLMAGECLQDNRSSEAGSKIEVLFMDYVRSLDRDG